MFTSLRTLEFAQLKNRFRSPVIFALLALLLASAAATPQVERSESQRYLNDIQALTTSAMEGRGDGSKGLTRAAHLIEQRFKSLGLEPAGTNSYFQPFTVTTGARLRGGNRFQVQAGNSQTALRLHDDFRPISFSSSGSVSGPLVFVGYGATAKDLDYDDYGQIDVKDKIVIVVRSEPPEFSKKSGVHGLTQHSRLITKAIIARNHGAKAVVLVHGKLGEGEEDRLTAFGSQEGPENLGIVLVEARNDVAEKWFRVAGKSLNDVQDQINESYKPHSFAFPDDLHISIDVNIELIRATVNNVLAYLPGQTDEYVIVGAHYDHLGRGDSHSLAPGQIGQIHPGADDNASGTAGVLELARQFAPMKGKLHRGILFASFAGEELGLLGSAAWVKEPTRPLDKAVAMLNMDMIGRIKDGKIYIGGVGTGSTFQNVLDHAQNKTDFKIEYSAGGFSSSDHTSFVTKHIPVLFFFSGLHSDYHKPSDTWDKINPDAAVRLLGLVSSVSQQLASAAERPTFISVVEDKPSTGAAGGGGYGPYFGSIPDFGQVENGVKFSEVRPGSPAAKSGLKAGDVLVKFGESPIKNLYDFTDALRRSKVGDVVEVTVLRDRQSITTTVKLEQRR
ncbi:MAG TPA: M28 family peptidase [Candidatus Angelobacter sp.]|jgi:hypothetical protein|nr:M28 family peptidase [Candidatus Angelobacter sp.]